MTIIPAALNLGRSTLRRQLFAWFFAHPKERLYLREIAYRIQADPANLSRELKRLEKEGVFIGEKRGNQKYFTINVKNPCYSELQSIFDKCGIVHEPAVPYIPVRSSNKKCDVHIVAGPNGAGKTTFATEFLPIHIKCKEFINADLIAAGLSPFAPEQTALTAGKLLLERIKEFSRKITDFAFETTLSGVTYQKLLQQLRVQGYGIHLYFLWLPSVEMALARVKDRVQRGGHSIPENVVRRRFKKSIKNFFQLYRPLVDNWILFDNSHPEPKVIARQEFGKIEIYDEELFMKISKSAEVK